MVPPTGPRGGANGAINTRTTRSSTGAARGGGGARGGAVRGGGIRKRGTGGPTRVDRDGDMMMDGPATANGDVKKRIPTGPARGRSGGGRGSRSKAAANAEVKIRQHLGAHDPSLASRIPDHQRKKSGHMPGKKTLRVTGIAESKAASNPDRGEKGVLEFLERKSAKMGQTIRIVRSRLDSDFTLHILVQEADADEILKLNGFTFAQGTLTITENVEGWPQLPGQSEPKLSQESKEHKKQLQDVLGQRYNVQAKLLNLSSLGDDPVLIGMGYLEHKDRAYKTFKVLMAICNETFPSPEAKREAVESISLANNNINTAGQVADLSATFPDLKNLDLSGNQLADVRVLSRWRGRFKNLETLLLNGNPLENDQTAQYKQEVMEWFPKLLNLSNVQVRTPEEVAAAEAARAAALPTPIPQIGADFRDVSGIGETFLTQFFPLYDSDRAQLANEFYDKESRFSLSVTTHTPVTDGPVLPWSSYLRYSRNLTKITNMGTRVQRLFKGVGTIKELWNTLPATKHPDLKTEIHKYIVDAHPLPGLQDPAGQSMTGVDGLIISMHGEFDEKEQSSGKTGQRSFTRTFVLGPAAPGSGKTIRVVSDTLSLRGHNALPDQTPVPSAPATEQDQKKQMIAELSKQTNMNLQYSEMCLAEVGWNFDGAMAKFKEIRPNLGPEVFMSAA